MSNTASVIKSTTMDGLRPLLWHGQPVHQRHPQLRAILKRRLGEEFEDFLAEPSFQENMEAEGAKARWMSRFMQDPVPFTSLDQAEQARASERIRGMLAAIEEQALALAASEDPDTQQLGEALSLAMEVPDLDCVMVQGDLVSLACWGFTSDKSEGSVFSLKARIQESSPRAAAAHMAAAASAPETPPMAPAAEEPPATPADTDMDEATGSVHHADEHRATAYPEAGHKDPYRWLWVVLILLLILLGLLLGWYLYSHMKEDTPLLPETPGMVPPDPDSIVVDTDSPLGAAYARNRLIILLSPGTDPERFARELAALDDGELIRFLGVLPDMNMLQVEIQATEPDTQADLEAWMERIRALSGVDSVSPEMLRQPRARPQDPGFSQQDQSWWLEQIQAPAAWEENRGNPDIKIAIIDSGFQVDHPELEGRIVHTWNALDRSGNVTGSMDVMEHGTHVAAIAAGSADNGQGVCGVCPDCSLVLLRAADDEGWFSDAMIMQSLSHAAEQGVRVVNMSIGMTFDGLEDMLNTMSPAEQEAVINQYMAETEAAARSWEAVFSRLAEQGLIIVQAAGNETVPALLDPMKRTSSTIVVAATNPGGDRASFSNYGPSVSLSAPGEYIYSAIPGGFTYMDGTSMASPAVAGAVGLVLSQHPEMDVRSMIQYFVATGIPMRDVNAPDFIGPLIQLAQGDPPDFDFPYEPSPQPGFPSDDCLCGDELNDLLGQFPPGSGPPCGPSPGPQPGLPTPTQPGPIEPVPGQPDPGQPAPSQPGQPTPPPVNNVPPGVTPVDPGTPPAIPPDPTQPPVDQPADPDTPPDTAQPPVTPPVDPDTPPDSTQPPVTPPVEPVTPPADPVTPPDPTQPPEDQPPVDPVTPPDTAQPPVDPNTPAPDGPAPADPGPDPTPPDTVPPGTPPVDPGTPPVDPGTPSPYPGGVVPPIQPAPPAEPGPPPPPETLPGRMLDLLSGLWDFQCHILASSNSFLSCADRRTYSPDLAQVALLTQPAPSANALNPVE